MSTRRLCRLALAMGVSLLAACGGGGGGSNNALWPSSGSTGGTTGSVVPGSANTDGTATATPVTPPDGGAGTPFVKQALADYVNTMRGANSSGDFTRGNTFPAIAVPFGFNFWTPVNRDDNNWF